MKKPPENTIWLSSMPRSGSTWLSQIFASAPKARVKFCPLFSYDFKNSMDEKSTSEDWAKLFRDVFHTQSEYLDQEYLRKQGLVPHFKAKAENPSHMVIKSTRFHNLVPRILELHRSIRFIHLVRDPRACIYSWLSNPYEFPEGADPMIEWRSGACRTTGPGEFWGFDAWKQVNEQAVALAEQYGDRFLIVKYEDLTIDPVTETQKMFAFCGLPWDHQTEAFLVASQSRHEENKRSVFKDPRKAQTWRDNLPAEISDACLNEVAGTRLEKFLQ